MIGLWLIVTVVCLATAHRIDSWEMILLPVVALIGVVILQIRYSTRYLMWTTLTACCPQCGTWPMNYRSIFKDLSSRENRGFLICEKCQIEWDLGLDSGAMGTSYNTSELAKNISDIIDKQVQNNDPPETSQTIERLEQEGHSVNEVHQMISTVAAVEVFHIICDHKPFNGGRYARNLKRLPQMPWDAQGKELHRV